MLAIFAAILAIPLAAYAVSRRFTENPEARWRTALRCAGLFALGLSAASPFLTRRAVGTGEAYNYSLAAADAVIQMRSGVLPPLVGQTEFAFNGRVHPLRNAPYLFYLIGGFDAVTRHRLSYWELQNFSLAFSLVAAAFACYGALRWGTGCRRTTAFFLAAAYELSPAVLAAAFTVNLFMTVHAAVFVPIALGACLRSSRRFSPLPDVVLAAALAGAWLAHPPVAFWLTLSVVVVRGLIFLRFPTWGAVRSLAGAAILGAALACFVFASVGTISSGLGYFNQGIDFGDAVFPILKSAIPGSLMPVPQRMGTLADFQLGYVSWFLLAVVAAGLLPCIRFPGRRPRIFWALAGSVAVTLLLLALALPIPTLTPWLWNHGPVAAQSLTNVWPMQRLYLVATGLVLFAAGLALPKAAPTTAARRRAWGFAIALGAVWTVWEARPFIARGFLMRWSQEDTDKSHLSSNIDLTVTAYSFLGTPPTFVNGVMDPQLEFRLLKDGAGEVASNLRAGLDDSPVVARGVLRVSAKPAPAFETEPQKLTLLPGRRYLLTFDFHTAPMPGKLFLAGPSLSRYYLLPSAGEAKGFGMAPGNSRSLSVWTAQDRPEDIEIRFEMADWPARPAGLREFAGYTLQQIDPEKLPVRLDGLLPLRFTVHAPDSNDYVETPRRYLSGYAASVNGRPVMPLKSPDWDMMVPVPQGNSVVELRYVGSPIVRIAFWLSAASWLGFGLWLAGRALGLDWRPKEWLNAAWTALARRRIGLAVAVAAGAVCTGIYRHEQVRGAYLRSAGPVRVVYYLPFHQTGRQQPLIVTGRNGEGTNVFLQYADDNHVRVGADIWGSLSKSEPIPVDYFQAQSLVVDSSALYPLDHPRVQALDAVERNWLRRELRVELNGRLVLEVPRSAFESKVSEVVIGQNSIGSSGLEPRFAGTLLDVSRLPFPSRWVLAGSRPLRVSARFPAGGLGTTEPLLALGPGGRDGICSVTYLPEGEMRFSVRGPDGNVIESRDLEVAPRTIHAMEFTLGLASAGSTLPSVRLRLDGQPLLGPNRMSPLSRPEAVVVGLLPNPAAGISARFTGSALAAEEAPLPPTAPYGPMRLIVMLPSDKIHRQDPLVTTGKNGKGDFIYVIYSDDRHIRLGFDHWGVSGGVSDPIPIDYDRPHEFDVTLGSLYPDEKDSAWGDVAPDERHRLKSAAEVRLDGSKVFGVQFAAHPSLPSEVTPGENRIGGSNCEAKFSGEVFSAERPGLMPGPAD